MKEIYLVTYDNEMGEFDKAYATLELAVEGIKATVNACKKDWENIDVVWFKSPIGVESANIYLQEDEWEELVHVNIRKLNFVE